MRSITRVMGEIFKGIKDRIDMRLNARIEYESRVVSKNRVLDIGGRNRSSNSRRRINQLNKNPVNTIICTDIIEEYGPDIVDDICNTSIKPNSFNGIYADAVLEHVTEYWKALENIYSILETGGEAFISIPFFFPFHDKMDYHRFTFTEVIRMLNEFSEVKMFVPGISSGYGHVFWSILTMNLIEKLPRFHMFLTRITNSLIKLILYLVYRSERCRENSFPDVSFYWIYLRVTNGFCAWAKK